MKKMLALVTIVTLVLTLSSCRRSPGLMIANWGEYLEEDLVRDFERKHGIRVTVTNYDSNSDAIAAMGRQNFDIVIPSEYAVEELAARGMIQEMDWLRLETDFGFTQNRLHTDVLTAIEKNNFDLLNWSVPYKWGVLGILYDSSNAPLAQVVHNLGWGVFGDNIVTGLNVALYDIATDAFALALAAEGNNINSTDPEEIANALDFLDDLVYRANVSWVNDNIYISAPRGDFDLVQKFSGCANWITMNQNEDVSLEFFVPDHTNLYINSMVIPTNAPNLDMAYEFIAFVSQHNSAIKNSLRSHHTTAIQSAFDYLTGNAESEYAETYFPVTTGNELFGFFANNLVYAPVVNFYNHIFFTHSPMTVGTNNNVARRVHLANLFENIRM